METIEATGTKQVGGGEGTGLLQSAEEWAARNQQLATTLNELLSAFLRVETRTDGIGRALDVGCQAGELTDAYGANLQMAWFGVDPDVPTETRSPGGAVLRHGFAHQLAFSDQTFDAVVFANVYEHIPPQLRRASLVELYRVLAPGGILVGQIPNPYFPIESHSRLPFFGYLPRSIQRRYWRLSPTGWDYDRGHFFSVTLKHLTADARAAGFEPVVTRNFNYAPDAIPARVRWIAALHARLGVMPWAWQFVYRKR